jgi:hypothetical protein
MTPCRRLLLSGAPFTPAKIPNLVLWFDASRITGLNDTDPVAQWDDVSGLSNHATQATASKKPAYRTAQVNGRPAVSFDGTDDFLSISTLSLFKGIGVCTIYVVTATGAITASKRIFNASVNGSTVNSRILVGRGRGSVTNTVGALGRRLDADTNAEVNSAINAFANDAWTIQTAVFDYDNSDLFVYLNGALVTSTTSFQTEGLISNTDSAATVIGANAGGAAEFYPGKIAELIAAVDKTARVKTEKYLSAKYGIALT